MKRAAYFAAQHLKDYSAFENIATAPENKLRTQVYATKLLLSGERWYAFSMALKLLSHDKERIQSIARYYINRFSKNLFQTWTKPTKDLQKAILEKLADPKLPIEKETLEELNFKLKAYIE